MITGKEGNWDAEIIKMTIAPIWLVLPPSGKTSVLSKYQNENESFEH
jgi:hypothetical protein